MATQQRLPEESGSGTDSDLEEDGQFKKAGKKRSRASRALQPPKRAKQDADVAVTLFEVVRQGKMAMAAIVDDWIEAYKADRNEALLDLIQFFINASGCRGTVTAEMLRDASEGFQDVIKRMTEEFDEDSGDYPLIASGLHFKKFRNNFADFVQALVRQCQYQIIYDQFMMDNVLTLLTELSNSQVRAFRHTSTLAAMKLMTALVNVALALSVNLDNTQRQYEAERGKAANKRATEKLDILLEKRKDLEDQQTEIESMLNGIFKQKEVRIKCLQTLQGLYQNEDMTKDLKLFTSRFKDRIVSMTLDKEYDVAVLAVKLLILILDHCGYDTPVLSSTDAESVYQLVYSVHRPVAVAAAEFLNKQLFSTKDNTPGYTKRGRRRSPNAPLLTDLVLFFLESELHEHATYLIDSLWDVASGMLKDWDCMTDLLLEEPANDRDQLDTRQESALVDIMVCSVKQAAEGAPPTGRQGHSKKLPVRDRRTVIEDRVRLTEHFIVALPSLLNKYQVDKEKVTILLQIPRFFDLELYTSSRLEKHLELLLRQMAVIVDKHTDVDLLEQASMTYRSLCDNDYTMSAKAQIERQTVIDSWAENFNLALEIFKDAVSDASTGADDEEVYNVVQALKRLTRLYMHNDLSRCRLSEPVSSIMKMYLERPNNLPDDMLEQAARFIHCDLMYTFALIKERDQEGQFGLQEHKDEMQHLRQRAAEFMEISEHILTNSMHPKVKEACYMGVCDLIIIFSPQLAHSSPNLETLVLRPSDALQHHLVDFVNAYVFTLPDDDDDEEDTAKIDALHHRRLLLAAVCKLFIHNMIEIRLAASVFQQYIRFYPDYGDIIKETISKTRHVNKMACAQTLGLSLMTLFRETLRRQGGKMDHSSAEYGHMKELARRLSLTFGLDQVKNRDAVATLHKEGILFALKRADEIMSDSVPPENLSFLSILCEFSSKLMRQDRKTVYVLLVLFLFGLLSYGCYGYRVNYLDKHIKPHMLKYQTAGWIPLVTYRNSLLQGADDVDTVKQSAKPRGRQRKKKGDMDGDGPRTPMTPATPMSPAPMTPMNPQHASTAQRDVIQTRHIQRDDVGLQHEKKRRLESWLQSATVPTRQRTYSRRNSSKNSILSSIFESDNSKNSTQLISDKMKNAEINDKEYESFNTDEDVKINRKCREESSCTDTENQIEEFTDEEAESSDRRNKLPDLDEEVIRGFDQNGLILGDVNSQDVKEQLSQTDDYYMDAEDEIHDKNELPKKSEKISAKHPKFHNEKTRSTKKNDEKEAQVVKVAKSKTPLKKSRSDIIDSLIGEEGEVFYDALPDIKESSTKSIINEKRGKSASTLQKNDAEKSAYSTRRKRQVVNYNEDVILEEEDREEISEKKKNFREPAAKNNAKKCITRKNTSNEKKLSEAKVSNTKLSRNDETSQSNDSTFLSNILQKIAQVSQNDVTIDDVTIDDEILQMWEDANNSNTEGSSNPREFGFLEMLNGVDTPLRSPKPSGSKDKVVYRKEKKPVKSNVSKIPDSNSVTELSGGVGDTSLGTEFESFSDTSKNESASTNPFSKITRSFGKDVSRKGGGDAHVFSDDVTSNISEDETDGETVTQRSAATVRTHISDVDVRGLLGDKNSAGISDMETETFGAFTSMMRDIHSQSSQNVPSGFSPPNGDRLDDFISEDESDGGDSFADAFASPKKDGYLSPLSTDDEDNNFAAMFGFGKEKKPKKKRQPNLMGASLQSQSHTMASPMHAGYHQPGFHPQMPGTPQQTQQQYVVPGQQMMYQPQPQGYQMQMQMQGQQQFYGN